MLEERELRENNEPEGPEEIEYSGPIPRKLKDILGKEGNLIEWLEEDSPGSLEAIRERVISGYESDKLSMKDYIERHKAITKLASMKADEGDKTFPFQGASKVMMQYLAQAAIDFNSRTAPEIVNKKNVAAVDMWGGQDEEKYNRGERVASSVNWQIKKGIKGWASMKDRGLLLQPVHGMCFNKLWWADGKIQESLIPADKMIYDHDADSFAEAPRKSHTFRVEINDYISLTREGQWDDIETLENELKDGKDGKQPEVQKPLEMIESHCTLDLDGDGYCEPYIVTWSEEYDCIVRIERRFHEDDVECKDGCVIEISGEEFFVQHGFIPSLDKPAVYDGWGTLLYAAFEQINTLYRQAIDANTLNITAMNSGFISTSVKAPGRSKSGRVELIQGQLTKVDAGAGQKLSDMIWTPQFQGMSQGFYQLLQDLKTEVMSYCAASQQMDVQAGEAASMYLARLQQALKVPNAIMGRVYGSMSLELTRIYDLMKRYMDNDTYIAIVDWHPSVPPSIQQQYEQAMQQWEQAGGMLLGIEPPQDPQAVAMSKVSKDNDFADSLNIITTADPSLGSKEERLYMAEVLTMKAAEQPNLYNAYEANKMLLKEMGVPNLDKVLPEPNNEPDPMAQLQMEWTKADIEKMRADSEAKMAAIEQKNADIMLRMEKQQAELDKILSETMKNLAEVDAKEASTGMQVLEHARKDVEMELEAQRNLTDRKAYKVMDHPEHGEITEADIQQTMADNGMTRDEVIAQLQVNDAATGA
jgi:hypothetical protein